jgi:hypothetical protein
VDASGTSTNVSFRTIDGDGITAYFPSDLPDENDLQDNGFGVSSTNGFVLFEIRNLIAQDVYDLAIYLSESLTRNTATRLDVQHQAGTIAGLQMSSPTFSLPGLATRDYLLFNDLQPMHLGDGSWGFLHTITYEGPTGNPVAGIVSGLQVEGQFLSPGPRGDYNQDGSVDAADYVTWRKTGGSPADYDTWRANFGATSGGGSVSSASVPEPATALLLCIGAVSSLACRARPIARPGVHGGAPGSRHRATRGGSAWLLLLGGAIAIAGRRCIVRRS